ncbi:MAG: sulfotransferase domain-containing protein [Gemmatimonadaceae bacterium]|nr:sulfotransferase domain-containing protein [Gemmatimonadaceae bacterium]
MTIVWWIVGILVLLFVVYIGYGVYLATVLKWEDEQTVGLNYYGLPPAGRAAFKAQLRAHARRLAPMLRLNARLARLDFARARIQLDGVSGPTGSCSVESFAAAKAYEPRPEDVFVVTQMKCGTTWMQNVVYEVLNRGHGDLVETGKAMYALSPWLEGRKSVPMALASPIGTERPSRIIKTHMPVALCPFNARAKYIYVARHPVSCFASCIDFVDTNVGGMSPELPAFEAWYTSRDLMWWGTWPDHVKGWWDRSKQHPNVLFVFFEDMKRDLGAVTRRVAEFLDVAPLSDSELVAVVRKCGFAYMQEHQDNFEMHPPHILQTNAELFVAGTADRYKNVPADIRARVAAWVAQEMAASDFPLARYYPDVVPEPKR